MKTISVFTPIKNEIDFIGYHCMAFYPYFKKFVWADGGSTDGTVELLRYIKKKHDPDNKIMLFENMDCNVYEQSYEDLYNFLLKKCDTEIVSYIHPDMIPLNPEVLKDEFNDDCLRWTSGMISFAGDRDHIWKDNTARADKWIVFNKNDFGLHYHGYYGDLVEDLFYKDLTGDEYLFWAGNPNLPYRIGQSKLIMHHYCDAKGYERRYCKMKSVFVNHSKNRLKVTPEQIESETKAHPRVTGKTGKWQDIAGNSMDFIRIPYKGKQPDVFEKYKEFEQFKK